jgi:cytochrome c2
MTSVRVFVRAGIALALTLHGVSAFAAPDPAALFAKKCSGCHTFGRGDRVGPDLKGVTERRTRPWLLAWVRSSQRVIASHDATAMSLFDKYKHERMPDQNLSSEEIAALLDYFAASGPLTAHTGRPRHAETANAGDIAFGRDLFLGTRSPRSGSAPCASCHVVQQRGVGGIGGSFAGDLTHVYSRYQDAALTEVLRRPCFPRAFTASDSAPLTDGEAFAMKAFLRSVDREASQGDRKSGGGQ